VRGLFSWQVAHLQTYSSANSFIPLPSYVWLRRCVVLVILGCPHKWVIMVQLQDVASHFEVFRELNLGKVCQW
jgi:hypothetical protein